MISIPIQYEHTKSIPLDVMHLRMFGRKLLLGVIVMSVNLLVDLTYGIINPRIRHQK